MPMIECRRLPAQRTSKAATAGRPDAVEFAGCGLQMWEPQMKPYATVSRGPL